MADMLKLLMYMEYFDCSLYSYFEYSCVLLLHLFCGTCTRGFHYIATYLVIFSTKQ